ncbi:MAG TPA: hypothetical protein VGJ20_20440 [Xanthobacteraceae bacterium]|jgi:hypothetical protein
MPRTIPDEEYTFLQGRRQVADFVESIYNDPQLNKEAKALIKKKYPNMAIPDYDIEQRVEERFATEKRERDERESKQREETERSRFLDTRKKTQDAYGFTDQAMDDLEKLMIERNVGDYEVAAKFVASQNPKPSEATFNDGRWNHDKAPGFKEIAADPEGWARSEILKSLYNDQERAKQQRF